MRRYQVLPLVDGYVDLQSNVVVRGQEPTLRLTTQERRLLLLLSSEPRPVPRAELLQRVWNLRPDAATKAPEQAIARLRRKLESTNGEVAHLPFLPGHGYTFRIAGPKANPRPHRVALSDGHIDLHEGTVVRRGADPLRLSQLERRLIEALHERTQPASPEELLVDVWNYHPRSASRAPYRLIQRLREKIEAEPSAPVHLLNEPGRGYRLVPHAPSPPRRPSKSFVGRVEEITKVLTWLHSSEDILVVTGPGGMGKTRLVREALDRAPLMDLVWIDLTNARETSDLRQATAAALGVLRPEGIDFSIQHRGPCLLVFDGADLVVEATVDALQGWLSLNEGAQAIVTTRRHLALADVTSLVLGPLPGPAAVGLLLGAVKRRFDWTPTEAERPRLEALATGPLDGWPLALELAGSRLPLLGLDGLTQRLSTNAAPSRDVLIGTPSASRWNGVREALMVSVQELAPSIRRAFAQCAVFCAPFDLSAAERILEPEIPALDALDELMGWSLLALSHDTGRPRFYLLDRVRDLALEELNQDAHVARTTRNRHLAWLLEASGPALHEDASVAAFEAVAALESDLLEAHRYALAAGDPEQAADLVLAWTNALTWTGEGSSQRVLERLDETRGALTPDHRHFGQTASRLLVFDRARDADAFFQSQWPQVKTEEQRAWLKRGYAVRLLHNNRFDDALEVCRQAREHCPPEAPSWMTIRLELIEIIIRIRRYDDIDEMLEALRSLRERTPSSPLIQPVIGEWMVILLIEVERYREALSVAESFRHDGRLPFNVERFRARALSRLGHTIQAAGTIQALIGRAAQQGNEGRWVNAVKDLLNLLVVQGRGAEARTWIDQVKRRSLHEADAKAIRNLEGLVYCYESRFEEAERVFDGLCDEHSSSWPSYLGLAVVALRRNDAEEVTRRLDRLLAMKWALPRVATETAAALRTLTLRPLTPEARQRVQACREEFPTLRVMMDWCEIPFDETLNQDD
ncbi:MAG: winged helix-turn-helix domain-containing protein [Myxococcota bacterium]